MILYFLNMHTHAHTQNTGDYMVIINSLVFYKVSFSDFRFLILFNQWILIPST